MDLGKTWIKAQSYNNKEPDSERVYWQAEGERNGSSLGSMGGSGRTPPGTTGVAWDPWQDQDALLLGLEELTLSVERSLTDSSLGHTKEGRGRTPRSRSSWGLVTKCGRYSRNSQDP